MNDRLHPCRLLLTILCLLPLQGCGSKTEPPVVSGERALQQGDFIRAEALLTGPAARGEQRAIRGLITIAIRRGQTNRAISLLGTIPAAETGYRAAVLERTGNKEAAGALYLEILKTAPRDPEALHGAARWHISGHRWQEARRLLLRLRAAAPPGRLRSWAINMLRVLPGT